MWNEKTNSPRSGKDAGADFVYYQFWNVITSSRAWVARDSDWQKTGFLRCARMTRDGWVD